MPQVSGEHPTWLAPSVEGKELGVALTLKTAKMVNFEKSLLLSRLRDKFLGRGRKRRILKKIRPAYGPKSPRSSW
jgi:hypothetical protein